MWSLGQDVFEMQSGYELWYRRLAHASHQTIRDIIKWAKGFGILERHDFLDTHEMPFMYG
jgi:hypothetical protein